MANVKNNAAARATRRRLIDAAGEVFADVGFHGATVRRITERAGVNVAAINYHFRDKAELYAAVLDEAHCKAQQCGDDPTPAPVPTGEADAAPEARLRAFVRRFLLRLLDPSRPAWHGRLMSREMHDPTRFLDRIVDESIWPQARQLAAIIRELSGGALPHEQVVLIGCSVVGQCLFYVNERPVIDRLSVHFGTRQPDVDEVADHIARFSLDAIRCAARGAGDRRETKIPRRGMPAARPPVPLAPVLRGEGRGEGLRRERRADKK